MTGASSVHLEDILAVARERPDVLGVYVFGSRGRSFMVDERSDWDVAVVLSDPQACRDFDRAFPYVHGALVEIATSTLDELRDQMSEHARYAAAHAQIVLDKTGGELARVVADQESLPPGRRVAVVREALDAYVNQTYRSLRYRTRLDAVEAIPHVLRTIFALEGRVRPYNKYLAWELEHHPLDDWHGDEGFGEVIDGWEPDVDWLRGDGGYREGADRRE